MTLMVKGTLASELRTRFWPTRLTYSVMTGSLTSLALCSTCCENCRPSATCFSSEYQLPIPLSQPTLRLPMASMSFIVAVEGAFFSGLSGAYWPSELELCGAELEFVVELWGLEDVVPCGAEGCPEAVGDAGELWVWARPKGIRVAASRPTKEKRIAERI